MYSLHVRAHSEVGKVRKNNQDSGYASPTLILVADGMGGAAAGDLASAVAVTELARLDRHYSGEDMLEAIGGGLVRANDKLAALVADDPRLDGMGTTVCGALFSGDQLGLAHIGDSRGYLLRDGTLRRLTHDHSWVQSLIDDGKLSPEQAETHPHRSLLLKVLNGQPVHEPDFELIDVQDGDRLLFCSDGLCGLVNDRDIEQLFAIEDIDEAVAALARAANDAGGVDNITIVAAQVVPQNEADDDAEPVIVGAAAERDIPTVGVRSDTGSFPSVSPDDAPDSEEVRYTPETRRFRWAGTVAIVALVATALAFGGWVAAAYARTKVFVGEAGEYVAIYQGIPGDFLGLRLNEVQAVSDTLVKDLPVFYQDSVRVGITVVDLSAAQATVAELEAKALRCIEVRKERENPTVPATPTPAPTPTTTVEPSPSTDPSTTPGASTSPEATPTTGGPFAPRTPYPGQPSDPQEC